MLVHTVDIIHTVMRLHELAKDFTAGSSEISADILLVTFCISTGGIKYQGILSMSSASLLLCFHMQQKNNFSVLGMGINLKFILFCPNATSMSILA